MSADKTAHLREEPAYKEPNPAAHANAPMIEALRNPMFHVRRVMDTQLGAEVYEVALNERHVKHLRRPSVRFLPFNFADFDAGYIMPDQLRAQLVGQAFITTEPVYVSGLMLLLLTMPPKSQHDEPTDYYEVACSSAYAYERLWVVLQSLRATYCAELDAQENSTLTDTEKAALVDKRARMTTGERFAPLAESLATEESRFEHTVARLNDLERQIMSLCGIKNKHMAALQTKKEHPLREHVHPLVLFHCQAMCQMIATEALRQRQTFLLACRKLAREENAELTAQMAADRIKLAAEMPPDEPPAADLPADAVLAERAAEPEPEPAKENAPADEGAPAAREELPYKPAVPIAPRTARINRIRPMDEIDTVVDVEGDDDAADMPSTPPLDPADVERALADPSPAALAALQVATVPQGTKMRQMEFKWPQATLDRMERERVAEEERAKAYAAMTPEQKLRELTEDFEASQIVPAPIDDIVLHGISTPDEYGALLLGAVALLDQREREAAARRAATAAMAAEDTPDADAAAGEVATTTDSVINAFD